MYTYKHYVIPIGTLRACAKYYVIVRLNNRDVTMAHLIINEAG